MTIITKPSSIIRKGHYTAGPMNLEPEDRIIDTQDEKIDVPDEWANETIPPIVLKKYPRSLGGVVCMGVTTLIVVLAGLNCAYFLYRDTQLLRTPSHRYQGFCAIPISASEDEESDLTESINYVPLSWSHLDPDGQVNSKLEESVAKGFLNTIMEQLVIDDDVERISVWNNGQQVDFIHDFESNITGIADAERCFVAALEHAMTLPPATLMAAITGTAPFDVSPARTGLRAELPPLAAPEHRLPSRCRMLPVYRLHRDQGTVIRKRSAEEPEPQFRHFAGRHVQEMDISNMAELLQYERAAAEAPA